MKRERERKKEFGIRSHAKKIESCGVGWLAVGWVMMQKQASDGSNYSSSAHNLICV
jgi:hypothetical protein